MKRRLSLLVALISTAALALPASGAEGSSGSFRVRVLPDPTVDAAPLSGCGILNAWVAVTHVGAAGTHVHVPAGRTLTVRLAPDVMVFAGDEGAIWRLRVRVADREVARSGGAAWRHPEVRYRPTRDERVMVLACNRNGYPDATVFYSIT